jgi:plasmid maintenance system killer protein
MNIEKSNTYKRDISKLRIDLSLAITKVLKLLEANPSHPSLHNKNIQCKRANNLYSIRINKQYRILYFKYEDNLELYRVLNHDKYDRLVKDC